VGLMVSMTWLSSNCRIFPILLGRLPPRPRPSSLARLTSRAKAFHAFCPRGDRRLQPWLLLLGRGGCSLGSDCVERAGHGPNRSLHAGRCRVAVRDPRGIIVGQPDMAFGVL